MDTIALVEDQKIDDGQRLLDKLSEHGFVVRAAYWAKPYDEDRWSLFIATPVVDEKGITAAYGQVFQVFRSLDGLWISDSEINLVGEKHPVAQQVLELQQRFPGKTTTQFAGALLQGLPLEEVVAYSLGKVEVTIYGMVFRGEPRGALHLSFEEHNPNSRITVEREGKSNTYNAEIGIDWVVAAPDGAKLEPDLTWGKVLAWDRHGHRMKSNANDVWSLANLGLHGFRFVRTPEHYSHAS